MPKKSPLENAAAPAVENPAFDKSKAVEMKTPYRHEPTARTVGFEQPLGDDTKALFSATRVFIAIEKGQVTSPAPDQQPAA